MRVKKMIIFGASLLALAACDQPPPNSGEGVGFNDYAQYELERARREAQLQGRPVPSGMAGQQSGGNTSGGVSTAELAAAGLGTAATRDTSSDTAPFATASTVQSNGAAAPRPTTSNPDISDEQDFDAVAGRESIESDAERRERQAAAYQLMEVTALPDRSGNMAPNIVQYALQAPNNRGEQVFSRGGFGAEGRFQRNCAKYRSPDDAQRDFLRRGGPQQDRLGLDPDGDGFACGWDPQAFRSIARN